jgi:hypothetical protein
VNRGGQVARAACALLSAAALSGCIVDHHDAPPPADTTIEFQEVRNIGYICGSGAQFSWTVHARETGDVGTAGCQQPIDFVGYVPGTTYTFDVTGTNGSQVCWQGSCTVFAEDVEVTEADCSGQITHLCGP